MSFKFRFPLPSKCKNDCCTKQTVCCEACADAPAELNVSWETNGVEYLPAGIYTLDLVCGGGGQPPCSIQETVTAFGCQWRGTFQTGFAPSLIPTDPPGTTYPVYATFDYYVSECYDNVRGFRFQYAFLRISLCSEAWRDTVGYTSGGGEHEYCDACRWAWYASSLQTGYSDGWTYTNGCDTGNGYACQPTAAFPLTFDACHPATTLSYAIDYSHIAGACNSQLGGQGLAWMVCGYDKNCGDAQTAMACGCAVNCSSAPIVTDVWPATVDIG